VSVSVEVDMVDRIRQMNERTPSSLAARHGPAARAASAAWASVAAAAALALLGGCGQKGPLYLPSTSAARPLEHAPSAPDDRMPSTQSVLPPSPSTSSPGLPTGIVPSRAASQAS
jgi:predicted small lipoprotein YifL